MVTNLNGYADAAQRATDCVRCQISQIFSASDLKIKNVTSEKQKLHTPFPWSWLQLQLIGLNRTVQFSPCPPGAFIPDPALKAYMTPLFKFLTEQHGAEAPVHGSIQSDLQQVVNCGGLQVVRRGPSLYCYFAAE